MAKPNFILILADDMGFSDLGSYGSEINTPNLDSLATNGIRFSQMYNSARCCPSRASLLTGLNPQQTGVGHMVNSCTRPDGSIIPSYQGYLNNNCATIAEVLRLNGYQTFMSGKWHVGGGYDLLNPNGWTPGSETHPIPTQRGFDRFFGIVAGGGNYFHPLTLMEDDHLINIDTSDFYFTDAISDHAVSMIEESSESEEPFFLHVAYTAPHWPLHALEEDIVKYEGRYRDGWDNLRTNRHEELNGIGLLDSQWEISPRDPSSMPWDEVPNPDWEDLRMAVYAAMVDRMDQGIGKILSKIKQLSIDEDTVVMFLSDNGGCAEFLAEDSSFPTPSKYSTPTPDGRKVEVGNRLDLRPGPDDTFMSYDLPWANASNSPFRLFKRWTHEGGISTPFVVSWPSRINKSSIVHEPTHIMDIAATIYDAAGVFYPKEINDHSIIPLEGCSFIEAIDNGSWSRDKPILWEHEGNRAMRDGEWKIVSEIGKGWEIYNMSYDRTELNDLVEGERERIKLMTNFYSDWMKRCDIEPWPISSMKWDPGFNKPHAHWVAQ